MNSDPNRDLDSGEEPVEERNEDRFLDEEETPQTETAEEEVSPEEGPGEEALLEEERFEVPEEFGEPEGPPPTNFDRAYPQLFFFLFCSLAMTIGCLLPWERTYLVGNLTGVDSIGGGLLICFSLYGVISGFFNIYHRKLIVWPVILAAIDGAIIGWQRVVQILGQVDSSGFKVEGNEFGTFVQTVKGYAQSLGPGLYLVTIFSSLVLISIVVSVFKGAKEDSRRKLAEREARMEARKSRRSA